MPTTYPNLGEDGGRPQHYRSTARKKKQNLATSFDRRASQPLLCTSTCLCNRSCANLFILHRMGPSKTVKTARARTGSPSPPWAGFWSAEPCITREQQCIRCQPSGTTRAQSVASTAYLPRTPEQLQLASPTQDTAACFGVPVTFIDGSNARYLTPGRGRLAALER